MYHFCQHLNTTIRKLSFNPDDHHHDHSDDAGEHKILNETYDHPGHIDHHHDHPHASWSFWWCRQPLRQWSSPSWSSSSKSPWWSSLSCSWSSPWWSPWWCRQAWQLWSSQPLWAVSSTRWSNPSGKAKVRYHSNTWIWIFEHLNTIIIGTDLIPGLACFLGCLFYELEMGIGLGVFIQVLLFKLVL